MIITFIESNLQSTDLQKKTMKTRKHNRINGIHVKCNYASQDFESGDTISKINDYT